MLTLTRTHRAIRPARAVPDQCYQGVYPRGSRYFQQVIAQCKDVRWRKNRECRIRIHAMRIQRLLEEQSNGC